MIQNTFGDNAMSIVQIKVGTNTSQMVEDVLKVTHILEGRQQAEHLRMLNVYGLQFTNIGNPGDSAPFSPNLAPCNFWFFPKLKSFLKGKRFIDEIQENTMRQLMMIPTKGFAECFEEWKRLWENCVGS